MTHYHVWFNLKAHVPETRGLAIVARFLTNLCAGNEAATFQLLRNKGEPPRSKLPRFHALVHFVDDAQLGNAMRTQTQRGIHSGLHGEMIDVVTDFHVEIFSMLDDPLVDETACLCACEI